jgi:erythromycin esterase-like protein
MTTTLIQDGATRTARAVAASARLLTGAPTDFDLLLEHARDAQYVLIGEASHGTHEF